MTWSGLLVKNFRADKAEPGGAYFPTPPLWVWVTTASIVVLFSLALMPAYQKYKSDPDGFIVANQIRIKDFARRSENQPVRVIALGSSPLYRGTYWDQDMEAFAVTHGFEGLAFLRISRPRGTFPQFSPLLDAIFAAKPSVLIIQYDLFFLTASGVATFPTFLYDTIGRYAGVRDSIDWNKKSRDSLPPQSKKSETDFSQYTRRLRRLATLSPIPGREIENLLSRARENNVQIIVLQMPRNAKVENLLAENEAYVPYNAFRETIQHLGIRQLQLQEKIDLDYFYDFSHLNLKGREIFSRWLITEIFNSAKIQSHP